VTPGRPAVEEQRLLLRLRLRQGAPVVVLEEDDAGAGRLGRGVGGRLRRLRLRRGGAVVVLEEDDAGRGRLGRGVGGRRRRREDGEAQQGGEHGRRQANPP